MSWWTPARRAAADGTLRAPASQDFFAVFFAVVVLAGAFVAFAAPDLAAVDLAAVDLAVVDLAEPAADLVDLAVLDFVAVDLAVLDFVAVDFEAADDFAVERPHDPAAAAPPEAARRTDPAAPDAAALAAFGSFRGSATTVLKPDPARNFGTAVFFTFTVAPVAGLRAVRAARSMRSNEPKPVRATFSPLATARWMFSSTASTASCAALRPPSRSARLSIS